LRQLCRKCWTPPRRLWGVPNQVRDRCWAFTPHSRPVTLTFCPAQPYALILAGVRTQAKLSHFSGNIVGKTMSSTCAHWQGCIAKITTMWRPMPYSALSVAQRIQTPERDRNVLLARIRTEQRGDLDSINLPFSRKYRRLAGSAWQFLNGLISLSGTRRPCD
jgi:hypothetical protein